jgi:hypothetical protein
MRIYEIPRNRAQRGGVFKREDSSMRVIGRRDLASGGEIQFPRGVEGELNRVKRKCTKNVHSHRCARLRHRRKVWAEEFCCGC